MDRFSLVLLIVIIFEVLWSSLCYYGAIHFHSNFCKFFGGIQFLRVLLVRFFLNVSFTVYSSDSSGGFLFFVSPLLSPKQ